MANHGTACSHVRIRNKYASEPDKYSKRQICRETVYVCNRERASKRERERERGVGEATICSRWEKFATALWVIDGLNSVAKGLELMCTIISKKETSIVFFSSFSRNYFSILYLNTSFQSSIWCLESVSWGLHHWSLSVYWQQCKLVSAELWLWIFVAFEVTSISRILFNWAPTSQVLYVCFFFFFFLKEH